MDDNNKPMSEFEKLAKEATGEIPVVNESNNIEEGKTSEPTIDQAPTPELPKSNENADDIQIVDDKEVDLPQTKEEPQSQIPTNIDTTQSDAKTIGTIKPDKQKSPITMLVLFGLLILFILFMPTVLSSINKYFGTNLNVNPISSTENTEEETKEVKQDITMYPLNSDTVIFIDKIEFGNFTKDNTNGYKLSFYIKNTGSVLYSFEKKLYLEYYNDDNTFVGRSYLENVKDITGGVTNNYTVVIDSDIYNKGTKVEVIQRTDDDYPNVTLTDNQLTCTNENDNLVYTFDNSLKLTNIKDMYTYNKGSDLVLYNNDLLTYKTRIANLDLLDGVTAILSETDNGFITTVAIDYQSADYSKISSNTNYYIKDTYARVISFEMNAKGYTCR